MKTSFITKTLAAAAVAIAFVAFVPTGSAYALDSDVSTRASAKGRYLDNDGRVPAEKSAFESQHVAAAPQAVQSGYANVAPQSNGSATYTGNLYKQPRASVKGPYVNNDSGLQVEKAQWPRFQR
jgi:hypothetical protein